MNLLEVLPKTQLAVQKRLEQLSQLSNQGKLATLPQKELVTLINQLHLELIPLAVILNNTITELTELYEDFEDDEDDLDEVD